MVGTVAQPDLARKTLFFKAIEDLFADLGHEMHVLMAIDKGGQCAGVLAKGSDLAGDFLPDFGSRQRPPNPALGYLGDFGKAPRIERFDDAAAHARREGEIVCAKTEGEALFFPVHRTRQVLANGGYFDGGRSLSQKNQAI